MTSPETDHPPTATEGGRGGGNNTSSNNKSILRSLSANLHDSMKRAADGASPPPGGGSSDKKLTLEDLDIQTPKVTNGGKQIGSNDVSRVASDFSKTNSVLDDDANISSADRRSNHRQQRRQLPPRSPSQSVREMLSSTMLGPCSPSEAWRELDLSGTRAKFKSSPLRMPTREESVEFVRSISLPEKLKEVGTGLNAGLKDGLNASVLRCVSPRGNGGGAATSPRNKSRSASADGGSGRAAGSPLFPPGTASNILDAANSMLASSSPDRDQDEADQESAAMSREAGRTFDTAAELEEELEDEMYRLQRMTSWNTQGSVPIGVPGDGQSVTTVETFSTAGTFSTPNSAEDGEGGGGGGGGQGGGGGSAVNALAMLGLAGEDVPAKRVADDDGNEIPDDVIQKEVRRRRHRNRHHNRGSSSSRRKRLVQFDYPPISSLRECPRTDPSERDSLFFSEEELDQIEDDRMACKMADDIEIVAVPGEEEGGKEDDNKKDVVPGAGGKAAAAEKKPLTKRAARKAQLAKARSAKASSKSSPATSPSSASSPPPSPVRTEESSNDSRHHSPERTSRAASASSTAAAATPQRKRVGGKDANGRSSTPVPAGFANYSAEDEVDEEEGIAGGGGSPSKSGGGRRNSRAGARQDGAAAAAAAASASNKASPPKKGPQSPNGKKKKAPMLQGVQIYLRQRSTSYKKSRDDY